MSEDRTQSVTPPEAPSQPQQQLQHPSQPTCQLCGGPLIEIRGKLQCERCHTIWETCCEGGRW